MNKLVLGIVVAVICGSGCIAEPEETVEGVPRVMGAQPVAATPAVGYVENAPDDQFAKEKAGWKKLSNLINSIGKSPKHVESVLGPPTRINSMESEVFHHWGERSNPISGLPENYGSVYSVSSPKTGKVFSIRIETTKLAYPSFLGAFLDWLEIRYDPVEIYSFATAEELKHQSSFPMDEPRQYMHPIFVRTKTKSGVSVGIFCKTDVPPLTRDGKVNGYCHFLGSSVAVEEVFVAEGLGTAPVNGKLIYKGRL